MMILLVKLNLFFLQVSYYLIELDTRKETLTKCIIVG